MFPELESVYNNSGSTEDKRGVRSNKVSSECILVHKSVMENSKHALQCACVCLCECLDVEGTVFAKRHFLIYYLAILSMEEACHPEPHKSL